MTDADSLKAHILREGSALVNTKYNCLDEPAQRYAAEHPDSAARAAVDEGLELGEDLQAQADALVTGDAEAAA